VTAYFVGVPHGMAGRILVMSLVASSIGTVAISSALGVRLLGLLGRGMRPRFTGAVRSLIWNSRVGEWAAKLLTPRNRKSVAAIDYRPTEAALGLAAEELFAALPAAYRENLHDLPAVVRRIEAHAAAARARIDELDALAAIGASTDGARQSPTEIAAARDDAKRDLTESVTALETIRLDLLRLHGGAESLRPITTALDAARELDAQLDRLGDAAREVESTMERDGQRSAGGSPQTSPKPRTPLPFELRPHTPV
jgi:serine/threonine-protein kinase